MSITLPHYCLCQPITSRPIGTQSRSVSVHVSPSCPKPLWLSLIACVPLLCLLLELWRPICWIQINWKLCKIRLWFYILIFKPRVKWQNTQCILGYDISPWVQDISQRNPYSPLSRILSSSRTKIMKVKVKLLSCVRFFVIPWTVACPAPLSMGFCRPEYWSGLPFPSPGIFPTHRSNQIQTLLHCRQILYNWTTRKAK